MSVGVRHVMPGAWARWRGGALAGLPYAAALLLLSVSFGEVARRAGFPALAAVLMSVLVFSATAQFAAVAIVASGGSIAAALVAAALVNSRYLAMGLALAPSLPGGRLRGALQAQAIVDPSWAISSRGDGTFDRHRLFGATAVQYLAWVLGTIGGVAAHGALGDPSRLGLDALFPAFFLALLSAEMRNARARAAAALGGAIALGLTPVLPAGLPILSAALAALIALRRGRR